MKFLKNQTEISMKLLRHQECAELPKKIIQIFDGSDVMKFPGFLQNFKLTFHRKCSDADDCLYYLQQFTAGTAHEIVKGCNQKNPEKAYKEALQLVNDEYGNEHKIAAAYIEKLDKWPVIKSEDEENLQKLYLFLLECNNNMEDTTSLNQLNRPKEIVRIVGKLPYELRKKWRERSLRLSEN